MTSHAPPVLAYDDLPTGSGITVGRGDAGELVIEVPGEPWKQLVRRSLRQPRFWAFLVVLWLSQNAFVFWQAYRGGTTFLAPQFRPMLLMQLVTLPLGILLGLAVHSRRWERITIDATAV